MEFMKTVGRLKNFCFVVTSFICTSVLNAKRKKSKEIMVTPFLAERIFKENTEILAENVKIFY